MRLPRNASRGVQYLPSKGRLCERTAQLYRKWRRVQAGQLQRQCNRRMHLQYGVRRSFHERKSVGNRRYSMRRVRGAYASARLRPRWRHTPSFRWCLDLRQRCPETWEDFPRLRPFLLLDVDPPLAMPPPRRRLARARFSLFSFKRHAASKNAIRLHILPPAASSHTATSQQPAATKKRAAFPASA